MANKPVFDASKIKTLSDGEIGLRLIRAKRVVVGVEFVLIDDGTDELIFDRNRAESK